jgi:hypothetical protein
MSYLDGFEPKTAVSGIVLMLAGLYQFFVQGRFGKDLPEEEQREMTTHQRGKALARHRVWGSVVFTIGVIFTLVVSRLIS